MHGVQKKEQFFYNLFCGQIGKILGVGEYFYNWLTNYNAAEAEEQSARLCALESECDDEAHHVLWEVNKSFITPFDREDIYMIVTNMDKIVDAMEKVANSFYIYDIRSVRPLACQQAEVNLRCIRELQVMFDNLKDFKKTDVVLKQIIEVNRLENVGDNIYRDALKDLFQTESDPIAIIKWQNIYDHLEKCTDVCEVVANTVEGVVMKHA